MLAAILGSFGLSSAEETPAPVYPDGWQRYELPSGGTPTSPYIYYWVYTPAEMKPGLPLVVYLHSTGGMINSAIKRTEKGLPWMIVNGDVPPPECIGGTLFDIFCRKILAFADRKPVFEIDGGADVELRKA